MIMARESDTLSAALYSPLSFYHLILILISIHMTMRPRSIARVQLWISSVEKTYMLLLKIIHVSLSVFFIMSTQVGLQLSGQGLTQHEK